MINSTGDVVPMALARVDRARQLLAEARTVDEVKDVRDKAEAIRQYSRTAGLTIDIQNYAAEIKIRAERKAGELLAEMPKQDGTPSDKLSPGVQQPPKLADIGITRKQSSRFQEIAAIPEPVFEEVIAETKAKAQEAIVKDEPAPREAMLTTAGVSRLAHQKQARREAATGAAILDLVGDPKGNRARAELRHQYGAAALRIRRDLLSLDPDQVADALTSSMHILERHFIMDCRAWLDRLEAALQRGPRLVKGDQQDG